MPSRVLCLLLGRNSPCPWPASCPCQTAGEELDEESQRRAGCPCCFGSSRVTGAPACTPHGMSAPPGSALAAEAAERLIQVETDQGADGTWGQCRVGLSSLFGFPGVAVAKPRSARRPRPQTPPVPAPPCPGTFTCDALPGNLTEGLGGTLRQPWGLRTTLPAHCSGWASPPLWADQEHHTPRQGFSSSDRTHCPISGHSAARSRGRGLKAHVPTRLHPYPCHPLPFAPGRLPSLVLLPHSRHL